MADYQTFGHGAKFEKHGYYRRPLDGEEAGWIVVSGTNPERQSDLFRRGFIPLPKYGNIEDYEARARRTGQMADDEVIDTPWRPILEHPDGPAEFPAEQVMILRWYKEEDCPVPGTAFPQLKGHRVIEYKCPECSRPPFAAINGMGGIEPLARHLRVLHSWDRASLVRYGERVGLDFDAIYSTIQETVEFGEAEKPKKKSGFACDECDWKPKANAKRPALALSLHSKEHTFQVTAA